MRGYNSGVRAVPLPILLPALALLLAGCPAPSGHGATGRHGGEDPRLFEPSSPIPQEGALLSYDKLHLGMSELGLSQAYNAPEGRGEGFQRTLQRFDAVSIHRIVFDEQPGGPRRVIVLEFYRDQLCRLVDRREGLTGKQAQGWLDSLKAQYGASPREVIPTAQWSWGDNYGVLLTFTRDNLSEESLTAIVVLVHTPTLAADQEYLAAREKDQQGGQGGNNP